MKRLLVLPLIGLAALTGCNNDDSASGQTPAFTKYDVTITNLTRGQQFTPLLVATHRAGVTLFTSGSPASSQLATLAEEGDTAPLTTLLTGMTADVKAVMTVGPLLDPGASRTVTIDADPTFNYVSVASMLIPTNDAFFAVNGELVGDSTKVFFSPGYDAGSEVNDEICASIPGPNFSECGGPGGGGAPAVGAEGFVHIHAGIHGSTVVTGSQLNAGLRDWRNPVAKIVVTPRP